MKAVSGKMFAARGCILSMKKLFRLYFILFWLSLLITLLFVGCGSTVGDEGPGPVPQTEAELSEEAQYLLGQWRVDEGRFGHKIFDFQEDGRLLIEDVETGELIEMSYVFVEQNTVILSGYKEFSGSATINFYENKLDLTINFDGTIFGELYVFTRVEEPSE